MARSTSSSTQWGKVVLVFGARILCRVHCQVLHQQPSCSCVVAQELKKDELARTKILPEGRSGEGVGSSACQASNPVGVSCVLCDTTQMRCKKSIQAVDLLKRQRREGHYCVMGADSL